jgi:VRR-NUC domain
MTFLDVLRPITERRFQQQVTDYAELMGWHWWHTLRSEGSPKGWPDLVLIRRPRIVFVELKGQRTPVTADQQACIDDLRACGQEAWIFRPSDWEKIERILR